MRGPPHRHLGRGRVGRPTRGGRAMMQILLFRINSMITIILLLLIIIIIIMIMIILIIMIMLMIISIIIAIV